MSYDFFVFPAERADDVAQALAVFESSSSGGTPTSGGAVALFLADVDALDAEGDDESAYVCTSAEDPMDSLRSVTERARAHGLSVLDVQLGGLYDPRSSLDVALDTEAGPRLTFVTRRILGSVVSHILDGRYHWVHLSRGLEVYAQTYRDEDGTWVVEHRDGGPRRHIAARTADADLVEELLWSWARNDGRWQAMLAFSPIEL